MRLLAVASLKLEQEEQKLCCIAEEVLALDSC